MQHKYIVFVSYQVILLDIKSKNIPRIVSPYLETYPLIQRGNILPNPFPTPTEHPPMGDKRLAM